MKYYKYENGFGTQPNNIIPSFATEITEEEYIELQTAFETRQKAIVDYVEKVNSGEMTLEEVPTEYYTEVDAIVNAPEPEEPITEEQALINEIIAEVQND